MSLFTVFLFDTPSKQKKDGTFPVTLRVNYKGKRKYYNLGYDAKPDQWNEKKSILNSKFQDSDIRTECNQTIRESLANAEAVRKSMAIEGLEFTLSEFDRRFRASGDGSISDIFNQKINDKIKPLAEATKGRYRTTLNSIIQYKGDIQIRDIDVSFVSGYIEWLLSDRTLTVNGRNGKQRSVQSDSCNETTVYNYLKDLRTVFNFAIKHKLVNRSLYPFHEIDINKYKIETPKRAITFDHIKKIELLRIDSTYGELAKDILLFSFYCRGINFVDIIQLVDSHIIEIDGSLRLNYSRSKTKKRFNLKFHSTAAAIIKKYQDDPVKEIRGFIFPILDQNRHITEKQILNRKKSMLKKINKALNEEIAPAIGLENIKLTSYVSRHTYANELSKNDMPIGKISQALGHRSQEVTKTYLRSIADYELDQMDEQIFG